MKQISGERLQGHWSSGYYYYHYYFIIIIIIIIIIYTPTLLYRGIFCIASFAYHANFGAQCPLAIVYVRHLSRQTSNAQLHRKLSKMSRLMVNKCIPLQKSCRKLVSANTGYPFPMKCPLSPLKNRCFYYF